MTTKTTPAVQTVERTPYVVEPQAPMPSQDQKTIDLALAILQKRAMEANAEPRVSCPKDIRDYLTLKLSERPAEAFYVVFFSPDKRVLGMEEMFQGTNTHVNTHPREILRTVLKYNADSIVLCHNHPTAPEAKPSTADIDMTIGCKALLEYIDVQVLDHIIVGGGKSFSMAENHTCYERVNELMSKYGPDPAQVMRRHLDRF